MDEVIEEASKKYQGLVPLVYDIETMGLDEARPQDMPYAVYLKREADKVIAEKDAEIARLKEQVSEERSAKVDYKISANDLSDGLKKAYVEINHHTYKRCLDKAKWCDERIARYTLQQDIQGISWQKEIKFYRRLKDKFIEISKRFEDPKPEASND